MTNKDLKSAFKRINERFFDSRIYPGITVRFGNNEDCHNCDGIATGDEILIHSDFKKHGDFAVVVLLHEMVHADLQQDGYLGWAHDAGHGTRFQASIERLYKAGAFDGLLILPFVAGLSFLLRMMI